MITLLILTYRNPGHLKRALLFYKKLMPKILLIVADSNSESNRAVNRANIKTIETNEFQVMHLEYGDGTVFSKKIFEAAKKITTPYSIIVGDDDFFSPQAIKEAVAFLESSPDYHLVYGHQYGFLFDGGEMRWYCSGYYENPRSFSQDDPLLRLESYLKQYTTTFYSVFRTQTLQNVLSDAGKYAPEFVFFDNMFTMQALLRGKAFFLEKPFWFKEMSNLSTSDTYNVTWFLGRGFEENKKLMEKGLATSLIKLSLIDHAQASKKSRFYIDTFMETTFYSMYPICASYSGMIYYKNALKCVIPMPLKKLLVALRDFLSIEKLDVGQRYLQEAGSAYSHEFHEVQQAIKESKIEAHRAGFEHARQL